MTISGTQFTGASAVDFAGLTAPAYTVNSPTSITATVPSGSGTVDVTVTTPSGTSTANGGDQFGYTGGPPAPTLVATYRGDLGRSGYYPSETGLTTGNAPSLKLHWTDTSGSGGFAQPIVADNMVFWSDWTGALHGTALTGTDNWATNIGTDTPPSSQNCNPASAGPTGAPTVATVGSTTELYVPGGNDVLYALNAQTGAQIWSTSLGSPPNNFLWDSPILYEGSIYEGVASYGDCPLVQGKLAQVNATTGAIEHIFDTVPNNCTGGGIWGSPTVDPTDGTIYVTTGTPGCGGPGSLAPSLVKLNASNLSLISSWTVPSSAQAAGDADFGATPVLFTGTVGGKVTQLVGAVDKNAIFYAFDRANLAAGPVWQSTLATASSNPSVGSIISAAWDGSTLYVGGGTATINGTNCNGNIDALNPSTGAFLWRTCQSSPMLGGITVVPGVIVEGTLGGSVLFLNAANGSTLYTYQAASLIEGECTVSNGIVYVPVANGSLVALGQ
ncbi:MAG TPA: PQQ-binding-like beta-propeller repeat protein [Acidimicrobiales bacterium]|nr:PQQ-binding-like beta-propeller repeat protein [Acidimicrobiales bacterium]